MIIMNNSEIEIQLNNYLLHSKKDIIFNSLNQDIVSNVIINYLHNIRKDIRQSIKNNNFNLDKLNNIINNYYDAITYLSNVASYEKLLIHFVSYILTDTIILDYLGKIFNQLDYNYHNDIICLFQNISIITKDYTYILNIIINKISYTFINSIVYHNIINHNIKIIYELNYIVKKVVEINKYFYMIKDNINNILGPIIYDKLLYIMKHTTLQEVAIIFKYLWTNINNIYTCDKIVDTILLLLKNNNELIPILNIIITSYSIFNNKSLSLIYLILNDKFESNELLFNVMEHFYNSDLYLNLLNIILNINNKDNIINNHYRLLTDKLFNNYDITKPIYDLLEKERYIFNFIKNNKINRLINDIETSYNYNLKYNNINVIITSYEICNINYNEGYVSSDLLSNSLLTSYNKYYTECNNGNKSLVWYLHYGEMDITYNNINIKLLPIQYMILELFNEKNEIPIDSLKILSNYTLSSKNKIIKSLVDSNIVFMNNNKLTLNNNTNFETDLIQVYTNISNYNMTCSSDFILDKLDITKTNINHILKTKTLFYDELYSITSNNIKIFKLNKIIFNKAIDYLIKMDYIIFENDKYVKLFF